MSGGLQNTTPDIRVRESVCGWGNMQGMSQPRCPCDQPPGTRWMEEFGHGDGGGKYE